MAQVRDPVCGMTIDDSSAAATTEYNGKRFYFCSKHCKAEFDKKPEEFARKA